MFGSFGFMELLLILIIVLIIFGAGKLPQLGEGLGKAIKGFKKSVNEPDAMDVTAAAASPENNHAPAQLPPGQGTGEPKASSAAQPQPTAESPQPST